MISTGLAIAAAGCGSKGNPRGAGGLGGAGGAGGAQVRVTVFPNQAPQVDILFVIDTSPSMAPLQSKFVDAIPAFMTALAIVPGSGSDSALPDFHIGVISSDLGAGKFSLPEINCPFPGDRAAMQTQPRGTCSASPITSGETFLAASMNQAVKNYTATSAMPWRASRSSATRGAQSFSRSSPPCARWIS